MGLTAGDLIVLGVWTTWVKPLWIVAVGALAGVAGLFAALLLLRLAAPKVAAIARTTAKEGLAQPLFYVLLAIGVFAILIFPFIPYYTFGEDIKMLKATGLTLIKMLAIILAVWTASVSIAEEIEGRTALTLLSKPIRRWQLILGKFLGILAPVVVMFIILGALFLASVSFKVVYDAREQVMAEPPSLQCYEEMVQIVPGLVLAFLEVVVLASISVAISTRLPMIPNLVICVTVYALGHLVPVLVNSAMGRFEIVRFVGQFLATVLPVLEHYSMEVAIATWAPGQHLPWDYLAWATAYCVLYSGVAMLVALLLFEDRDLA